MSVEQSTLSAFMDAVTDYYGGADIWTGITDNAAFTSADFAAKVTQVDGVSAVYNAAGDVLYYKYNNQIVGNAVDLSNVINSNTGSTIASTAADIPANTTIGTGSAVNATSGMQAAGAATAKTVIKDVALGVAAVSAGIQLGATIDGVLYNLNPDFWDEHNMSSLNPQTWDTLVSDYGEPAQAVFNMVFGIDKTTNQVQPYMDERVLAYITQYMIAQGAFGGGDPVWDGEQPETWNVTEPVYKSDVHESIYGGRDALYIANGIRNGVSGYAIFIENINNGIPADMVATSAIINGGVSWILSSKTPYSGGQADLVNPERTGNYGITGAGSYYSYEYDNKTVYLSYGSMINDTFTPVSTIGCNTDNFNDLTTIKQIAWLMQYGTFNAGSIEGITAQDGATLPTGITPDMSIDDVIAQLQILYPDLFTNAITNSVVQPDGTIKTYTYVPVAIPENVPLDDVTNALKPTGGVDLLQGQTSISPDTTPDSVVETLLSILSSTNPYNPTQTPTQTDYPETGEGTTPAVILPTGSASALYSIYNPTQAQLNSLGAWLWSSNFVDQILKLFNDPMQAIIGLHKVFATPPTSGTGNIKVGYLDSGVSANLVSAQYTEVDCGSVSLKEYFGNALDYTDTDIYLYLPFVGIVPVSALDVTRSTINVKYKVDVLTGACMAQVYVNRDNNAGGQLYCYAGDCAVKYPLSSGSYMGIVASVIGIAGSVAGTIASGGAMLPLALGAGASALNGARTRVEHSGQLTGNAGAMGIKKPYFIIRRPQTKIADNFQNYNGQSNNIFVNLGSCSGYTRVRFLHLENIPATGDELTEIENILKSGVII